MAHTTAPKKRTEVESDLSNEAVLEISASLRKLFHHHGRGKNSFSRSALLLGDRQRHQAGIGNCFQAFTRIQGLTINLDSVRGKGFLGDAAGQPLPVKPLMARTTPSPNDLLQIPAYAKPDRVDELMNMFASNANDPALIAHEAGLLAQVLRQRRQQPRRRPAGR